MRAAVLAEHGQRCSGAGLRQPGLPVGQRRTDARRATGGGKASARSPRRRREPRRHNGSTARMCLRTDRAVCQAGGTGRRGGDAGGGASGRPRRTSCSCRPGSRWQPAGRWRPVARSPKRSTRCWPKRSWPGTGVSPRTRWRACRPPCNGASSTGWTTSSHGPGNWPMNWRSRWPMPLRPTPSRCVRTVATDS